MTGVLYSCCNLKCTRHFASLLFCSSGPLNDKTQLCIIQVIKLRGSSVVPCGGRTRDDDGSSVGDPGESSQFKKGKDVGGCKISCHSCQPIYKRQKVGIQLNDSKDCTGKCLYYRSLGVG